MAFTKSKLEQQLLGAVKIQVWDLDFDSVTEGQVVTGLDQVRACWVNNETSEDQGICFKNKSDASTTLKGSVFINGVTSDDLVTLIVIGV